MEGEAASAPEPISRQSDWDYFSRADEAEQDDGLPPWLEGDTLAPPCSSAMDVVTVLVKLANLRRNDLILDLGCGDGRVCVHAALHYGCRSWGVECDPKEAQKFRAAVLYFDLPSDVCKVSF